MAGLAPPVEGYRGRPAVFLSLIAKADNPASGDPLLISGRRGLPAPRSRRSSSPAVFPAGIGLHSVALLRVGDADPALQRLNSGRVNNRHAAFGTNDPRVFQLSHDADVGQDELKPRTKLRAEAPNGRGIRHALIGT